MKMNKALRSYGRAKALTQTPMQMVETVFDRCAFWMDKVGICLMENNHFERYVYSEKIIMALTNLIPLFDESSPDQKKFAKEMKEFCVLILSNLTDINHKQKHALCVQTQKVLKDMASIWQNV